MEEDGDGSPLDEREATDFRGREELEQRTSRSEDSDLVMLMKAQFLAAEKREERLEKMLKTEVSATAAQLPAAVMKSKQISAERPVLLSTASLAEFSAWEESWYDYAVCQQLTAQSHQTRVSAVRLSFHEEVRRYLREGIGKVSPNADVPEFIKAVKTFIFGQRNPLLDRIDFYNRQQDKGESLDSFYAALRELYNVSDFPDLNLCQRFSAAICGQCETTLQKVKPHRDRNGST